MSATVTTAVGPPFAGAGLPFLCPEAQISRPCHGANSGLSLHSGWDLLSFFLKCSEQSQCSGGHPHSLQVGTVMLEGHRPLPSLAVGVPGPLSLQWRPASPHPRACGSGPLCRRNRCSFWKIASCRPCAWQPRLGGPSHSPGRCFCWNQPLAGSEISFLRGLVQEVTNAHWALCRTLPSGPLL